MFNFKELTDRYRSDAPFNKAVNLLRRLIEEFGFQPNEIRQAAFLAEYMYRMDSVEEVIRTQAEWEQIANLKLEMRNLIVGRYQDLEKYISETPPTPRHK